MLLRSILIGLASGARSLTPIAAVSDAASRGALPRDHGGPAWLGSPIVSAGLKALAAAEVAGDKMKTAPDRIVPAGMIARVLTAGLAGAALAPRKQAALGAVLGATAAVGAAYLTFHLRMKALDKYGQTPSGLVEDALTVGAAKWVVGGAERAR